MKALPPMAVALTAADVGLRRLLYGAPRRQRMAIPGDGPQEGSDAETREWLRVLRRSGFVVVRDYFDATQCQQARSAIDEFLLARPDRVWTDSTGADRRVYGFERVNALARRLLADPRISWLARSYWRDDVRPGFVSAGRLEARAGNRGSGGQGWHRDGVTQQFKALLYLSDVGAEQGPFALMQRTTRLRDRLRHNWSSGVGFRHTDWDEATIGRLERTCPGSRAVFRAPAGTLILADTFALHRGMPIATGTRHSLTASYFPRPFLDAVVRYYNRQVVQADGALLTAEGLRDAGRSALTHASAG